MTTDNRAFEEMLKPAVERVQKKQPEEISENAGVYYNKNNSEFEIITLDQKITVKYPSCEITEELEGWHTLLLLHYMDIADGTPLAGEWVTFGSLKDGLVRGMKFDHTAEEDLQNIFHGKTQSEMEDICRKSGGRLVEGRADLCAEFSVFPKYPILLNLWMEDEEFPLTGKFFADKSADHYLTMEDTVTAGCVLLDRLKNFC